MAQINLKVKSDLAKASADLKKFGNVSADEAKRIEKFRKSFQGKEIDKFIDKNRRLVASYKATGQGAKGLRAGQRDLERRMQQLIKKGIDPQSAEIQQLQGEYNKLASQAQKAGRTMSKSLDNVANKAQAAGRGLSIGLTLPLVGLGIKSVQAFDKQEEALKRLDAAIISTGRESQISAGGIADLAAELQKTTTFGDEATIKAAALTQQFANLDEEGLRKVIPSLQDFAAAMGTNIDDAAKLVGKTLGSSTNALSRYGIEIDMTGDKTEKLAELTEALESKFGGTAEALAKTAGGQLQQARNRLGDVTEEIGKNLLPAVASLATSIAGITEGFSNLSDDTQQTIVKVAALAAGVGPLLIGFSRAIKLVQGLRVAMIALSANPILLAATAVTALGGALVIANKRAKALNEQRLAEEFEDVSTAAKTASGNLNDFSRTAETIEASFKRFEEMSSKGLIDVTATERAEHLAESLGIGKMAVLEIAASSSELSDNLREELQILEDQIQARIRQKVATDANAFATQQAALNEQGRQQQILNTLKLKQQEEEAAKRQAELDKARNTSQAEIERLESIRLRGIISMTEAQERMKKIREDEIALLKEKAIETDLTDKEIERLELLRRKVEIFEEKLADAGNTATVASSDISEALMLAGDVIASTTTQAEKYQNQINRLSEAQKEAGEGTEDYERLGDAIDILQGKMEKASEEPGKTKEEAEKMATSVTELLASAATNWAMTFEQFGDRSDQEWSDFEEAAAQHIGVISSMMGETLTMATDMYFENQKTRAEETFNREMQLLDQWYQKQLEVQGLAEETNAERIQRELEEAKKTGNQELIEKKKTELAKAKLDEEYAERKNELEKEKAMKLHDLKVQQFRADQAMAITQTIMYGAQAAMNAYASLGPVFGAIAAGVMGGITAAQVAIIASQPPPPAPTFQTGTGSTGFTVPDTGGRADSQPIMVSPGERVDVTPRGEAGGGMHISVDLDGATLIDFMNQKIESQEIRITADNIQGGMAG